MNLDTERGSGYGCAKLCPDKGFLKKSMEEGWPWDAMPGFGINPLSW